jgi:glycerol-3-phosphate dehydrogenase (NAD(P)+)
MKYQTALVFGGGAFGTAVATVLCSNFKRVILKVRSKDVYESLQSKRENGIYLPGQKIPDNLYPALSWEEAKELEEGPVEVLVSGLPTKAIGEFSKVNFDILESYFKKDIPFVSLSKGMDSDTLELANDIYHHYFSDFRDNFTYLSGPSFAKELMDKNPTAVSLAGRDRQTLEKILLYLETPFFKVLPCFDVRGVLLGGALKNLLTICGGIVEGLGFGHNTIAALITLGINEMLRFGVIYNARPETFYGPSGMGDLILSVTGNLSRNKQFGMDVATGVDPEAIILSHRYTVEGYKTTKAAYFLAEKFQIKARLTRSLYNVLYKYKNPLDELEKLMKTPSRFQNLI